MTTSGLNSEAAVWSTVFQLLNGMISKPDKKPHSLYYWHMKLWWAKLFVYCKKFYCKSHRLGLQVQLIFVLLSKRGWFLHTFDGASLSCRWRLGPKRIYKSISAALVRGPTHSMSLQRLGYSFAQACSYVCACHCTVKHTNSHDT